MKKLDNETVNIAVNFLQSEAMHEYNRMELPEAPSGDILSSADRGISKLKDANTAKRLLNGILS